MPHSNPTSEEIRKISSFTHKAYFFGSASFIFGLLGPMVSGALFFVSIVASEIFNFFSFKDTFTLGAAASLLAILLSFGLSVCLAFGALFFGHMGRKRFHQIPESDPAKYYIQDMLFKSSTLGYVILSVYLLMFVCFIITAIGTLCMYEGSSFLAVVLANLLDLRTLSN